MTSIFASRELPTGCSVKFPRFARQPFYDHAPEKPVLLYAETPALGWDACDVILMTGDAYIDHPSFGMALTGRLLEAQGFRAQYFSCPVNDLTGEYDKKHAT